MIGVAVALGLVMAMIALWGADRRVDQPVRIPVVVRKGRR